jgi:nitrite reductase (NADH) large subunit
VKVVIVGNGLAGTIAAKTLREADASLEIVVFGNEKYLYYPRPNLIEFLAGRLPYDRLFAFPKTWYDTRNIEVRLSMPVHRIRPESRVIETADGKAEPYDALCLADGAFSFVPPIKGSDKKGVLTLRSLDDAQSILERLASGSGDVVVIGGGLLGLEIARALSARGSSVTVLEFFPTLLPRQLDPPGGAVLRKVIEASGIRVRVGVVTEEILGDGEVRGLRLKSGEEIPAGTIIIAAGVKPHTGLALDAGLAVEKGVLVNDAMETSRAGIYAAGDGNQHRGRCYGIIPASFEQARTAAWSILGRPKPYGGTVPSNSLKVMGIALSSVGVVNPENPAGVVEIRREIPEAGVYKKLVLQEGRLIGVVWMGTKKGVDALTKAVSARRDVSGRENDILSEDFDFANL